MTWILQTIIIIWDLYERWIRSYESILIKFYLHTYVCYLYLKLKFNLCVFCLSCFNLKLTSRRSFSLTSSPWFAFLFLNCCRWQNHTSGFHAFTLIYRWFMCGFDSKAISFLIKIIPSHCSQMNNSEKRLTKIKIKIQSLRAFKVSKLLMIFSHSDQWAINSLL